MADPTIALFPTNFTDTCYKNVMDVIPRQQGNYLIPCIRWDKPIVILQKAS